MSGDMLSHPCAHMGQTPWEAEGSVYKSRHETYYKETLNLRNIGVATILWEGTKPNKCFFVFINVTISNPSPGLGEP